MSYKIKEITIEADNSSEGLKKIADLWSDVLFGKLPLMQEDKVLVARYSKYKTSDPVSYDFSILSYDVDQLKDIEYAAQVKGRFKHFTAMANDVQTAVKIAWDLVYKAVKDGVIIRTYINDYEISTPSPGPSCLACCELYISTVSY